MNEIKSLADKLAIKVEQHDYLGEIVLTKSEYERFCTLYGEQCVLKKYNNRPTLKRNYDSILALLAVNCAYFEYDESGFWTHFLKKLGISEHQELQETIGRRIENYLFEKQFIEIRRTGAFRYVGAILEQTGITRRSLPRFVEFLKDAINRYGLSGLIIMPPYLYDELLTDTGKPSYLVNFLKDDAGVEFIRSTARSLDQARYEQNKLLFLKSLKGYRPSFWEDFLEYFEDEYIDPARSKKINSIPTPRYLYQPTTDRLVLLFDIENVKLRKYRYDGELVVDPSKQLLTEVNFKKSYFVEVEEKYRWHTIEINGWLPHKQPYAFFDSDSGELLDVGKKAPLGNSYLVISIDYISEQPDKCRQSFQNIIIGEYNWLNIRISTPLRGYLVEINPDTNLDFLGLEPDSTENRLMGWEKGKVLTETVGADPVFLGAVPDLILYQPELFERRDLRLLVDVENGNPQPRMPDGNGRIKLPYIPPTKGTISVEPLGRQKGFRKYRNKQLSFCCIPPCQIIWPKGLLAYNERASVRIETTDMVSVSFSGNCSLKEGSLDDWLLPPEKTFVEGVLSVNNDEITIPIGKHLPRAAMLDSYMAPVDVISMQQLLDEKTFYLTGYPGSPAKIFLCSGGYRKLLADLGTFDKAGKIQFTSAAIKDSVRNLEIVVGVIGVGYYGEVVLSGTRLYDTEKMENQLCQEAPFAEDWIEHTDPKHQEPLSIVRDVICDRLPAASFAICEDLPYEMKSWGEEIIYCAKILDNKRIEGTPSSSFYKENEQLTLAFEIITKVQLLQHSTQGGTSTDFELDSFLKGLEKIVWRPRVKRWQVIFEEYISNLRADLDILGELLEWKDEVLEPGKFLEYKSWIGKMPLGKKITNAWKQYLVGADKRAYGKCETILGDLDCCPPISDLARILKNILLYKRGIKGEFSGMQFDCHSKLLPIVKQSFSLGKPLNAYRETGITGEKYLPLKDSDKNLF